jgi:hypothetical protein
MLHPDLAMRLGAVADPRKVMPKRFSKEKKPTDISEKRGDSAEAAKSPTLSEISRLVSAVARKGGKKNRTGRMEKSPG